MRSKLHFVLILIFGFLSFSFGQETSFPKPIGFVNDFENLIHLEEVTKLEALLINYEKQTSNEIVVVTISEIGNGNDFDNYALALAQNWAVGKIGKDNGLVIVISNQLGRIRICTGTGTEKILTDEICNTILEENIIPNFKNGEIYKGIESGINALIEKWK
ncbi:TPM domain-containing protein [Flavobacterium sp. F372]|uniref:TPM domain-containing protein n=1 Tax=Flavobacterium bernardetii TaxID=2813823 RepID=A0ABR7IY16_9FLAO|nr:TPM domain-containing protein [Flavobacterium bernardetii]MBC5834529.1 TPM domain-containing protein [Flavobacterium bernardetii]NHF70177.1 TPM domain-containing protein [Flavobacterium bernardetii]